MPYYHVYIESNVPRAQCFELDKTDLSELKEDVILPYLKGNQFHFDGYFLDKKNVARILIIKSGISYKEYARQKEQRSRFPAMYRDILTGHEPFEDITSSILKECESQIQEATTKPEATTPNNPKVPMDKSKVFIVHGHDDAKHAVARVVGDLGFEAIILDEQASSGNTIIEKIEEYTNVGFGIVLYTPCDEGRLKGEENQLKPRARQNVVFEHGYLIGKIGRKNVCALVKGDIEKPTDISGVVYIPMDEGGGWKLFVAKEMKKSGYDVDLNKI